MKLDKNTKHNLMVGDVLRFSDSEEYEVLRIIRSSATNSNALNLTLRCPDGRVIYGTPSSHYYGAEIISRAVKIIYRDDLGYAVVSVDADGVSFCDGFAYFYDGEKDYKISASAIQSIC